MPAYKFNDFKQACKNAPTSVILLGQVQNDADEVFNLRTKLQLLSFIANDGLENLHFINRKEWESNPDKANPILVDAYEFKSISKLGYIAFMYSDKTKKWLVKSFKLSKNRNPAMFLAFQKAGLMPPEENNE